MFAARDQENLVHGHQQVAASKPLNQTTRGLQPKTPGNKYPKTPLKVPLNDENAPTGFGKTGKGKGLENLVSGKKVTIFDKNAFVTPLAPRERAPLGAKTTNAKAKALQTPAGPTLGKELEQTQANQTSARRPKKVIHADTVKLEVHGDESPLRERDVEYCPPKPTDIPFDSEDFPDGCLDYSLLKPENMMRDMYQTYCKPMIRKQAVREEKASQEAYEKAVREHDESLKAMMEEEWTIGDVPETFRHLRKKQTQAEPSLQNSKKTAEPTKKPTVMSSKGPGTITSRKAASALAVPAKAAPLPSKTSKPAPKPSLIYRSKPPAPLPSNASTMRHSAATAASKSTIGYTKGRSTSGALHANTFVKPERSGLQRSVSNMSQSSDTTITPANFREPEWKNPSFLKAFEVDDEDLEPGLRGMLPDCLRRMDEDEEEFFLPMPPSESK